MHAVLIYMIYLLYVHTYCTYCICMYVRMYILVYILYIHTVHMYVCTVCAHAFCQLSGEPFLHGLLSTVKPLLKDTSINRTGHGDPAMS